MDHVQDSQQHAHKAFKWNYTPRHTKNNGQQLPHPVNHIQKLLLQKISEYTYRSCTYRLCFNRTPLTLFSHSCCFFSALTHTGELSLPLSFGRAIFTRACDGWGGGNPLINLLQSFGWALAYPYNVMRDGGKARRIIARRELPARAANNFHRGSLRCASHGAVKV